MTRIKVYSKALDTSIHIERVIGHIKSGNPGPTLIFMGGIHGNEPAGVFAMDRISQTFNDTNLVKGQIIFIAGNLQALEKGTRYESEDLNRVWTRARMGLLPEELQEASNPEVEEQIMIYKLIRDILKDNPGPFYFFDIHTTSSETLPFLTVNDSLLNRAFTSQYPIPIILGIEEYLDGPILSYINELGYVAFGFEAGQHDDLSSIENAEAFCYLSMIFTGILDKSSIDFQHYYNLLAKTAGDVKHIYEIFFRHLIKEHEAFEMQPGFFNFQKVHKNQLVAISDGKEIRAKENGRIFMPLYQPQGSDGFFTIRRIRRVFLNLSTKMRKYRLDRILAWLPGVNWLDSRQTALVINRYIAIILAKELLHLLGYRSIEQNGKYLVAFNRESEARNNDYQEERWFTKLYDPI
ncbi:succinylglutamate desuccinylase/aspartoacylase family protein [Ekhidna sp.]|uniref:succinylglutamate desuccinylase/aspartoacylase family protein n=1 Tax=Ekhidna sp. TaxID=2608089 RepID=UPI003B513356